MPAPTVVDAVYEIADSQDGYFTARQASDLGVSKNALVKAALRDRVERISRGVYRLVRYPVTSPNAYLWEAVLWPQTAKEAPTVLSYHTALRLHQLSDVNPDKTHITLPRTLRVRRVLPPTLIIHRDDLAPEDIMFVDGLPTTSVARTLRDIATTQDVVALHDAIRDARERNIPVPPDLEHA